jgi:hypothetical protein
MAQTPRSQSATGDAPRSTVAAPATPASAPAAAPAAASATAASAPAATVPSGATVKVETPPAAAQPGPTRRVVAVGSFLGGTPTEPETIAPGAECDLPEKEARRLVDLGLARWPGEAASAVSPYDEAIKDTTAKIGEGKADEAEQRVENHGRED